MAAPSTPTVGYSALGSSAFRYPYYASITPHDSTNLTRATDAVFVGSGGIIQAVPADGGAAVPFTCVDGQVLPIAVQRINATSTTATLLVGLWTSPD